MNQADSLINSLKLTRESVRVAGHLDTEKHKTTPKGLEGRKWCVFVDASVVSQKTFDCAIHFIHIQNGKGWKDDLVAVHAYHPREDSQKAIHLQGSHVLSSYETKLIKARREYEQITKHELQASVLLRASVNDIIEGGDSKPSSGPAHLRNTLGTRHPNVDTLIEVANEELKADWVVLGFHQTKQGRFGATADFIVRMVDANVICIKHWRPLPEKNEEHTFVVGVDGSQASFKGLTEILYLAKRGDKVHAVVVSKHEGSKDREIMDKAQEIAVASKSNIPVETSWRSLDKSARNAAEHLCIAAEELGADFLVIASRSVAPSTRAEHRERLDVLGSTAVFCTLNSKCHNIIVKPHETSSHTSKSG